MKIITVKQNGKEWHAWRGKGLGASDAPVVMGDSPWTTRFELWLDKTGLCPRAAPNEYALAAMRRGHDLEPIARALAEKQLGRTYSPVSAEHREHAIIRASFDGYEPETNTFIEIKAPSKVDHAKAVKGEVPTKYYAQLQQQFLVSGATTAYYCSFDGKSDSVAIVEVKPTPDYLLRLEQELISFWTRVETQIPPEVTKDDLTKFAERVEQDTARLANSVKALRLAVGD